MNKLKFTPKEDLTYDADSRGDIALFIDVKHFTPDDWQLDDEVKFLTKNRLVYFRVIQHGIEGSHGWIDNSIVVQWG